MATNNAWNSNIPVEIAKGGTNATTMATTDGVVYYDGTRLVTTTAGTAAQVLTSNGAGVAPSYQSVTGGLIFIQSQTASNSASINFTTGITNAYSSYFFCISNVVPITTGTNLQLKVSTDGGGTWIGGTGYNSQVTSNAFAASTWTSVSSTSAAQFNLSPAISTTATPPYGGFFYIYNVTNGNVISFDGSAVCTITATTNFSAFYGVQSAVTTVNGFQFLMSSGNISTGTFSLFAIKES